MPPKRPAPSPSDDKPAKPQPPKPAIRLDDLIPDKKILGGRSVTFGVRPPPPRKP